MTNSKFITFEGVDCAGKTTILPILADHLRERGWRVVTFREPGGTKISEQIRTILLENIMDPMTQLHLFAALRNENMNHIVKPYLALPNMVIISDRFADSTYAYQGFGGNLVHDVMEVEKSVLKGFEPHHTLFFDIPFEESERRLEERAKKAGQHMDAIEARGQEFRKAVYNGYQERFLQNPQRMHRIDALPAQEIVAQSVIAWANAHFENLT